MELKYIKQLMKLLEESTLHSLEVENEMGSLKLQKAPTAYTVVESAKECVTEVEASELEGTKSVSSQQTTRAEELGNSEQTHMIPVLAPLVGTFYGRRSPQAEPFVSVGDIVQKGDVLCIIEAMKVMNEITAKTSGRIRTIEKEDGAAVGYNDVLFQIDPE